MTKHDRYNHSDNETSAKHVGDSDAPTVAEVRALQAGMKQMVLDVSDLQKALAELKAAVGSLAGSAGVAAPSRPVGAGEPAPELVATPSATPEVERLDGDCPAPATGRVSG